MLKKTAIAFTLALLASSQNSFAMKKIDGDEKGMICKAAQPISDENIKALVSTYLQSSKDAIAVSRALLSSQNFFPIPMKEAENSTIAKNTHQIQDEIVSERLQHYLRSAETAIAASLELLISSQPFFYHRNQTTFFCYVNHTTKGRGRETLRR